MYKSIEDFVNDWKTETELTKKIFGSIDDDKKDLKVNENVRSLARMAWHITQTLTEMPFKSGIVEKDFLEKTEVPESFKTISELYNKYSCELVEQIEKKWTDEMLLESIELYGQNWQRQKVLNVLIRHEIHHRAQMTVVMRLAGITVPGIYGPAKEEWVKYGMEPQD